MSFTRRGPMGGFAFGERLPSSVMNDVTLDISNAIDGVGGGTYAPSPAITIGGSGLIVTGTFSSTGTASLTGGSITLGNSAADQVTIGGEVTFTQDIEFTNDVTLGNDDDDDIRVGGVLTAERYAHFDQGFESLGNAKCEADLDVAENLHVSGDAAVDGDVEIDGDLKVDGSTTLGASSSDTVSIKGRIDTAVRFVGNGRVAFRPMVAPDESATISVADANWLLLPQLSSARTYTLEVGTANDGDFMVISLLSETQQTTRDVTIKSDSGASLSGIDQNDIRVLHIHMFMDGAWRSVYRTWV